MQIKTEYLEPDKTVIIVTATAVYELPTMCHGPGTVQ